MEQPLVSIVITCYNYGRFVSEAIESSLQQTHSNTEVVVVDDGSTDDTASVCKRYIPRITYLYKPNGGVSQARNYGVRACSGEFVMFLDADDILDPGYVEECLAVYAATPGIAFVYTQMRRFEEQTSETSFPEYDIEILKRTDFINVSALMPTEVVRQYPYEESNRRNLEDWDFYLTLAAHGYYGALLDKPLLLHRRHGNNRTGKLTALSRQQLRVYLMWRHLRLYGLRMFLFGVLRLQKRRAEMLYHQLRRITP